MWSWLNPYMGYIKIAFWAAIAVAIITLFFTMKHYKSKADILNAQLSECQTANIKCKEAVDMLGKDVTRGNSLCEKRLNSKDAVIVQLRKINSLKEGASNESINSGGNALLDSLGSMYPKAGGAGGICTAGGSGGSGSGGGQSGDILYCLTRQDALNLLSNKAMHDGREKEMEEILNSFQAAGGGK